MPLSGYLRVDGLGSRMTVSKPGVGKITEIADGKIANPLASKLREAGGAITNLKQLDRLILGQSKKALEVMPQPDWDKGWGRPKKAPASTRRAFKAAVAEMDKSLAKLVAETLPAGWGLQKVPTSSDVNYHDTTWVTQRLEYNTDDTYQEVHISFNLGHRPTEDGEQRERDRASINMSSRSDVFGSNAHSSISSGIDLPTGTRNLASVSELLVLNPKGSD